jgi:hypothetical protein
MNEVGEAIERITERFDPARGFDDLSRRRDRTRTKRRVVAGGLALTIAAAGSLLAVRAFPSGARPPTPPRTIIVVTRPASASATISTISTAGATTDCPAPSDEDRAWALSSTSGTVGSSVDVSGTFQSGEFWVQLWWNADGDAIADQVGPPPWPPTGPDLRPGPAGSGPVVELAEVAGPASGGECSFHTRFVVPDVEPGTYQLVFVMGGMSEPPGEGGYAVFQSSPGSVTFEVSG